jgi:hypothetical protein
MKIILNIGNYRLTFNGNVKQTEDTMEIDPTSIPMWNDPAASSSGQWTGIDDPSMFALSEYDDE